MSFPIDIIDAYYPTTDEISADTARLASMRDRLEVLFRASMPDVDMRPNSVYGDLVLTPLAHKLAGAEIAMGRFMSDLDLENVANNVIYHCPFVEKYIQNFAVLDESPVGATGTVRITFGESATEYILDRRTRFQFGSDIFYMRLPEEGDMMILPVGDIPTAGTNNRVLVDVGSGRLVADIPVYGTMTTAVEAGDTGATDILVDGMLEIVALHDFNAGTPPSSLPSLAKRARTVTHSATPNTRNGAKHFITRNFPDVVTASVCVDGDSECLRSARNPLGLSGGVMDIRVKSTPHLLTDTQTIRLRMHGATDAVKVCVGKLLLANTPVVIDSIVPASPRDVGNDVFDLATHGLILSKSLSPQSAPLLSCAYSPVESFWIRAKYADSLARPMFNTLVDDNVTYADFVVTYRYDPVIRAAYETMISSDSKPIGVDALVAGFIPVVVSSLEVEYARAQGTTMNLDAARSEIYSYLNSVGYPDVYSDAKIIDSMFYAGAKYVRAIKPIASVKLSIASKIISTFPVGFYPENPTTWAGYWATLESEALTVPSLTINDSRSMIPVWSDVNVMSAVGQRNLAIMIDEDAISFSEEY